MNPTPTPSPQALRPELTALAAEFSTWRAQRTHRSARIPLSLRDSAVDLLKVCRRACIIKALGINHAMLKAWQDERRTAPPPTAFVPLEVSHSPAPMAVLPTELTLANRSGQQVTLQGPFSGAQLALVARALSEPARECAP